jgi:hypothetical protein
MQPTPSPNCSACTGTLGVCRATVTESAGDLQRAGLISYRHGRVKILKRTQLERAACECDAVIRDAFALPG